MVGQDEEQTKKTHGHDLAKKNRSLKKMSHFSEILEDTQKKKLDLGTPTLYKHKSDSYIDNWAIFPPTVT